MFTNHAFHIKYGRRAYINCPVCGLRYEQEPGFFEGAMYFNYALNVATMVTGGVATYVLLNDPNEYVYFGITAGLVISLVSVTSRLSKSLMLHLIGGVKFEKRKWEKAVELENGFAPNPQKENKGVSMQGKS